MKKSEEIIKTGENYFLNTYNRYPVVLDHGEGVYLYDIEGKRYLDFFAGIAVYALGHGNREFNEALKGQIDRLLHTSNLFYNEPASKAAEVFCRASGMDRVFFTNSGTEAIEGAIKTARKYAYLKDGGTDHEIISMEHSFHGRSMGALSVTGNPHYREAFGPDIGNIRFASFNDLDSVRKLVNDKTCAIIMETVQGEGGVYPADPDFLKEVRKLCDERDILLILDEIQCGMGRTGSLFAWQSYGVKPDVMTSAKALGCGVPVGAFAMTAKVADHSLVPGDHGSTYGGNPFAATAVLAVFEQYEKLGIVDHVREVAPLLEQALDELKASHACIVDRRGKGLLQALELDRPVAGVIADAREEGLLLISAGANTLRFVPPLTIGREDIQEMKKRLDKVLGKS
ncbi:MAG: aspartate aminotransferase family protein [Lachnospiraceae bacterium]|nr:aspartate aminotransferase family protein [Lachnospiraceae bacterium]